MKARSELMRILLTDVELKEMREEWTKKYKEPFWLYNHDQFGGIDDYKSKIRRKLNDPSYELEDPIDR